MSRRLDLRGRYLLAAIAQQSTQTITRTFHPPSSMPIYGNKPLGMDGGTLHGLVRRGYVKAAPNGFFRLTEAGRVANTEPYLPARSVQKDQS